MLIHAKIQNRPFSLRSRSSLIAATVLLQAVVIGLGWLAMLNLTRDGLETGVHARALDECARVANDFAQTLEREFAGPIKPDTPEWDRAMALVNASQPPGGSLFLLDQGAVVLCHPSLGRSDALRRVDYAQQRLRLHPSGEMIELGQLRPKTVLTADTEFLNGSSMLAMVYDSTRRVKIVATMPHSGAVAATRQIAGDALLGAALAGAAVILLTILGSVTLVRRYDSILIRANRQLEDELERRMRRGLAIRNGLIFGLAKLADYRDTDTGKHLERICSYSEALAAALQGEFPEITRPWIEQLKLASSMHDIGKVGVADSILLKPGALTPEERRLMEQHAVIGADTLIAIRKRVGDDELLNMGIQVALSHHERWDGKGYPYNLAGEQIPLSARIVSLADIYDALTSTRVYKAASSHAEAADIIRSCRATHLDPRIVDAFVRVEPEFERIQQRLRAADERPALLTAVELAQAARAATVQPAGPGAAPPAAQPEQKQAA